MRGSGLEGYYLSIYYAAEKSANLTEAYPSTRILSKLAIQLVRRATVKWFMHARLATLEVSSYNYLIVSSRITVESISRFFRFPCADSSSLR